MLIGQVAWHGAVDYVGVQKFIPVVGPMIQFNCASCGKAFTVPDEAAGRTGKCNKCGHKDQVPAAASPAKAAAKISTNAPAKVAPAIKKAVTVPTSRTTTRAENSQSAPPIPAAQTVPQSVVPQTIVVVQQEKKRGNSLAIASVIVAVLAFAFCWIPLLGILSIPVGLIALLLVDSVC